MMRRLTAIVMIWVSLLGAALPAFACASAGFAHDCCAGAAGGSPCAGDTSLVQASDGAAMSCCASGHPASPNALVDSGRSSHESDHCAGSPDTLAPAAWSALPSAAQLTRMAVPPPTRAPPGAASRTYLHTARLRL